MKYPQLWFFFGSFSPSNVANPRCGHGTRGKRPRSAWPAPRWRPHLLRCLCLGKVRREIPGKSMGKSWCVYIGNLYVPWSEHAKMMGEMSSIITHPWKSRWITGLFFTHQIHRLTMDWWIWWPPPQSGNNNTCFNHPTYYFWTLCTSTVHIPCHRTNMILRTTKETITTYNRR